MIATEEATQRAGRHVKTTPAPRRPAWGALEELHSRAAEAACDLAERHMAGRGQRKPPGVCLAFAAGAMIGAAFGIYRH